jgi:zinc transporter
MHEQHGITTFVFDGNGGRLAAAPTEEPGGTSPDKTQAFTWIHLNRTAPEAIAWLNGAGLDGYVIDALTAEETRPRLSVHGDCALLNLRGVNLNPGAEPEDMISIRIWIEPGRVISTVLRRLMAVDDLREAIDRQQGPVSPGDLIAKLALRLADRAEPTIAKLNEDIDALEEQVPEKLVPASRTMLADVRRSAIVLRRYMFPQRDALSSLEIEDFTWLKDHQRHRLREATERIIRLGEELDAIRDRAQIVHDQIMDMRSETMNRQMLVLSIVAALFLPLGLLTGLLGINVGGIPGTNDPWAFSIVCAVLVVIGAGQVWLFRRMGLF